MLIFSGVKKIHVCAPSNAAVDEILARISQRGIIGVTKETEVMRKMILRLAAFEYDSDSLINQFTLDTRLKEVLNDAKEYELKE